MRGVEDPQPQEEGDDLEVADVRTNAMSGDWINSIEHLLTLIAPRTVGRHRVLRRLAELRQAQREASHQRCPVPADARTGRAVSQGSIISLARRRIRDMVLMLAYA